MSSKNSGVYVGVTFSSISETKRTFSTTLNLADAVDLAEASGRYSKEQVADMMNLVATLNYAAVTGREEEVNWDAKPL